MSVAELLNTVSANEIIEWQIYHSLEPFGEERADLRMGILAATIANVNRKKGTKAYKPIDFMPKFYEYIGTEPTKEGLALKIETLKGLLSRK